MAQRKADPQTLDEMAAEADEIEARAAAKDGADGNGQGAEPATTTAADGAPPEDDRLAPGAAADAGPEEGPDELATLRAERDELLDRWKRSLADAENTRKRAERDRREAENYGSSKLARDLLPVHDSLSRAIASIAEEDRESQAALIAGIELTMRELLSVFRKHGIEPIAAEAGDRFDPKLHQAMFEAPVPGTKAGEIIQVMAEGFMLHDRLLRPAQVGVSSTPAS